MPGKTQDFLGIEQLREGIIILKNKSLRGILMVSSTNFSLKSEEEQNAIIYQFQNFLNSLDFFCQIVVQSRKINITDYLEKIKEMEDKQANPLLKMQTEDYRRFVQQLVETGTILTKSFYLIIPYFPTDAGEATAKGILKKSADSELSEKNFQRYKQQIWQRMEFVSLGLMRCGLRAVPLTSAEIAELLWSLYHPTESETGRFPEFPPEMII